MDFLTKVLAAMLGRFLADDLKAWCPFLTDSLINLAVRRLPSDLQDRYVEEWRAHIADTPGEIGKLFCAAGFLWAGWRVWEAFKIKRLRSLMEEIPGITHLALRVFSTVPLLIIFAFILPRNSGRNLILTCVLSLLVALVWALETPKDVKPKIRSGTGK
jgi:hypothetical protein